MKLHGVIQDFFHLKAGAGLGVKQHRVDVSAVHARLQAGNGNLMGVHGGIGKLKTAGVRRRADVQTLRDARIQRNAQFRKQIPDNLCAGAKFSAD